jgi:hypothetical protein
MTSVEGTTHAMTDHRIRLPDPTPTGPSRALCCCAARRSARRELPTPPAHFEVRSSQAASGAGHELRYLGSAGFHKHRVFVRLKSRA